MDLSIFKICGWNILQPSNRKLLEEFIDENEPWLLIGLPCRDSFLMIQYLEQHFVRTDLNVKESMPLRDSHHESMQGYMQQHDVEWRHEHPGGHTSWRESTKMECSKIRSESSEYMWKTTGFFTKKLENQNSLGEQLL